MESFECPNALAKQVLSQLSYTPTATVTFIPKHFRARRNPFLRTPAITVPERYQDPRKQGLAPRQWSFHRQLQFLE